MEPASDLLIFVGIALLGTIATIIVNLLSNELYDGIPRIAAWIIRAAVNRLPRHSRNRYQEEWLSHASETNGKLGALFHALGCYYSTFTMEWAGNAARHFRITLPNGDLLLDEALDDPTTLWLLDAIQNVKTLPPELEKLRTDLMLTTHPDDHDPKILQRMRDAMEKAAPSSAAPPSKSN